ncbi:MAG: YlmC/YmxH family sporulation protein [Clostridia bacterium]|nr:YlmC/YmxH family sporulation protein [Clostridia bacterium]
MVVSFSDLSDKEVINLCDGKRLGYVCDADIDTECGKIIRLSIPAKGGLFPGKSRIYIRWENIERIGEDIILVKYTEVQNARH